MGDLGFALKEAHLPIHQEGLANRKRFLYIGNALKPNELQRAGTVKYFGYQAFGPFLTYNTKASDNPFYLNEIGLRRYIPHPVHLGFINVAVGYQFKQVFKGVYVQLFFEQIGPLRPYTLQILNGIG
jgi:hypothetical protein